MRKLFIIAASLLALAIPTAAMANVAVDNGVGFVGKGDVQTALGLKNDAEMQDVFKSAAGVKFSVNAEKVIADYKMSCFGSDAIWAPDHLSERHCERRGTCQHQ
jgi:parvulin-like peptidyl-prolyl isomerase